MRIKCPHCEKSKDIEIYDEELFDAIYKIDAAFDKYAEDCYAGKDELEARKIFDLAKEEYANFGTSKREAKE